jgi:hypothetical protein
MPLERDHPAEIEKLVSPEDLIKALAWHALTRTGALDISTGSRSAGAVPLVYVDTNPWGRHLDDASVPRNLDEARGFASLVDRARAGGVRIAYSSVTYGEGADHGGSIAKSALRELIGLQMADLPVIHHAQQADTDLVAAFVYRSYRIKGLDAIHAASALLEGSWYFVTGDDPLRRRMTRLYDDWSLPASAVTPATVGGLLDLEPR